MTFDAIALFRHEFTLVGIGGLLLLALLRRLFKLLAVLLFASAVAGLVLLSGRWDAVVHALY